jgi:hypothetical protein
MMAFRQKKVPVDQNSIKNPPYWNKEMAGW